MHCFTMAPIHAHPGKGVGNPPLQRTEPGAKLARRPHRAKLPAFWHCVRSTPKYLAISGIVFDSSHSARASLPLAPPGYLHACLQDIITSQKHTYVCARAQTQAQAHTTCVTLNHVLSQEVIKKTDEVRMRFFRVPFPAWTLGWCRCPDPPGLRHVGRGAGARQGGEETRCGPDPYHPLRVIAVPGRGAYKRDAAGFRSPTFTTPSHAGAAIGMSPLSSCRTLRAPVAERYQELMQVTEELGISKNDSRYGNLVPDDGSERYLICRGLLYKQGSIGHTHAHRVILDPGFFAGVRRSDTNNMFYLFNDLLVSTQLHYPQEYANARTCLLGQADSIICLAGPLSGPREPKERNDRRAQIQSSSSLPHRRTILGVARSRHPSSACTVRIRMLCSASMKVQRQDPDETKPQRVSWTVPHAPSAEQSEQLHPAHTYPPTNYIYTRTHQVINRVKSFVLFRYYSTPHIAPRCCNVNRK